MAEKTGAGGKPQEYDTENGKYCYNKEKIESHYKWAVDNGRISALVGLSTYTRQLDLINKMVLGKVAAAGTTIKHVTFHCIDRICGTTEKENNIKHEGIALKDFEYTLFNGTVRKIKETNTIIFISDKCKIATDPLEGVVKQCNRI